VDGLRYHKGRGLYYRLDPQEGKRASTHYYPKRGLQGVAYLRSAVREHLANVNGYDLPTTAFITTTERVYDDFGEEIPLVATVDENGLLVSGIYVPLKPVYTWVHDQIANPATRRDFAAAVGIPELVYLDRLRPDSESLAHARKGLIHRMVGKGDAGCQRTDSPNAGV
jgi:hypothetical protein